MQTYVSRCRTRVPVGALGHRRVSVSVGGVGVVRTGGRVPCDSPCPPLPRPGRDLGVSRGDTVPVDLDRLKLLEGPP